MGVLGKAAAKGWSVFGKMLWKGGEQVATKSYRVAEHIAMHPIKSVKVGAVAYGGWQLVANNKPIVDSVKDYGGWLVEKIAGEDRKKTYLQTADDVKNTVKGAGDKIRSVGDDVADATKESVDKIKDAGGEVIDNVRGSVNGVSGGDSMSKMGGFLGNVTSGNINGLSVIGLLLSAYMLFGRTGILGKVGGLLMGMLALSSSLSPSVSDSQTLQQNSSQDMSRGMHI